MIFFINNKFVKNNKILNILYINNRLCFYYKYKIQKNNEYIQYVYYL